MSVVEQIREPRADYLALEEPALLRGFELMATAEGGVAKLRELILSLATQGKLARQDHSDEPATTLLRRIAKTAGRTYTSIPTDRLPEGWAATTFGEYALALCTGPFGSLIGKDEYIEGGIPLVNPSHMKNGRIEAQSNISVLAVKANDLKAYALRSGDIVFARRGDVGRTAIVSDKEDGWLCGTGSFFARFHPDVDREFVQMIFNSVAMRSYLGAGAIGTTMVNLNQRALLNAPLRIPPLAEQHRIVARVEELMTLCDKLEARGQLADAQHARLTTTLFDALTASNSAQTLADNWQRIAAHFDLLLDRPQAIDALEQTILQLAVRGLLVPQDASDEPISSALARAAALIQPSAKTPEEDWPFDLPPSWEWRRLASLHPDFQNGISSRGDANGIPITVIRLADITNGRVSLNDPRVLPISAAAVPKYGIDVGDILVIRVNGSADLVGKFVRSTERLDAIYCDHFIRMRLPSEVLAPGYLELVGSSKVVRGEISKMFITTAGQKTINQGHIGALPLPIPPLAEQHRIVSRVEHLRRLCDDLRERLDKARATQTRLTESLVTETIQPQRGVRLA